MVGRLMEHWRRWPEGYRESAPSPALASCVLRVWTYAIPQARDPETAIVIPDGCADIIWVDDAPPVVVGPMTAPVRSWPSPGSHIVGVRLRPGMAGVVLREACQSLTDRDVPLAALWGDRVARRFTSASDFDAPESDIDVSGVVSVLGDDISSLSTGDVAVLHAIDWLRRHPRGRQSSLVREVGLSERQLRRRFVSAVGYGPKMFQRIMRVQHCLATLQSQRQHRADLATLAVELGFVDQAHMTRELRHFTGRTPCAMTTAHATGWTD